MKIPMLGVGGLYANATLRPTGTRSCAHEAKATHRPASRSTRLNRSHASTLQIE
jgi:hypothetical protein